MKLLSDWPELNKPVTDIYFMETGGRRMWIQLPCKFREEDDQGILIDNAQERVEIKKKDKTVQYSATMTNQGNPVYKYDQLLEEKEFIQYAYLFGRHRNGVAESHYVKKITVEQIEQESDGTILIYAMFFPGMEDELKDARACVDAATRLPEKFIITDADPNSLTNGQIVDEYIFDFSPIPDSTFEYVAKNDETVLPFRQQPCFRGQVVDMMENPVPDADVFIHYFPLYSRDYLTCKSDANGNFEIELPKETGDESVFLPVHYWATIPDNPNLAGWTILARDDYFFGSDIRDYISGCGGDILQSDSKMGTRYETENGVTTQYQCLSTIQEKPVISNIQLVMESAGTIGGYITDKAGNVIPNVKLKASFQAYDEKGTISQFESSRINWKFSTLSDANGYYEFTGLPPLWKRCQYTIYVSAEGFVSERKTLTLDEPLRYQEFDIFLESKKVTIEGFLKDNYGTALKKRSIHLSVPNMSIFDCSTTTDPNGFFILEGCPDVGGLKVRSSLSNDYPENGMVAEKEELASFLLYPDLSEEVSYVSGQQEYFIELTAIRPETQVEVFVTDSAGKALPEFKVKLDGFIAGDIEGDKNFISYPWQHLKLEKRTDSEGRIMFDNVPDLIEMKLIVLPDGSFTREMHALNGKINELQRLNKIDEAYRDKYQQMEIPIELIEGQMGYSVDVVVLMKEEALSLPEEVQQ